MKKYIYTRLYKLLTILSGHYPHPSLLRRKVMIGTSLLLFSGSQLIAQNPASSSGEKNKEEIEKEESIGDVTCYLIDDDYVLDQPEYIEVEDFPEFPGGMAAMHEYISKNLIYPQSGACVQGRVIIQFVVNEDGSITNETVVRSIHPELDENALILVRNMPNWKPGKKKGIPIKMLYTVPVTYKLQE